jgi:hypothetical protein
MQIETLELSPLPSLDAVRVGLRAPTPRRRSMAPLLLAAVFAAIAGVSVAGVMILGPGGGVEAVRSVPLGGR